MPLIDSFRLADGNRRLAVLVYPLMNCTLFDIVKSHNGGAPSVKWLRCALSGIMRAVALLERLGLIHGDIKPENIFSTDESGERLVLGDFGSVRRVGSRAHGYEQSRWFRAPEHVLASETTQTCAVDLWGVGCIVVEMVTGWPAFPGSSNFEMLELMEEWVGPMPGRLVATSGLRGLFRGGRFAGQCAVNRVLGLPIDASGHDMRRDRGMQVGLDGSLTAALGRCPDADAAAVADVVDLVHRLLAPDPQTRITAEEALKHPFLTKAS